MGIVRPHSAIGMCTLAEHEAAWASDTKQDRQEKLQIIEGDVTANWKQTLDQLSLTYPDRSNPHL